MNDIVHVDLLVDPASPTSWAASRWLQVVVMRRPVDLTMRMAPSDEGRGVARVALAASDLVGSDGPVAVYEAYGRRRFVLGETDDALDNALTDLGLPGFLGMAIGDTKWDAGFADPNETPLVIDGTPHTLPDLGDDIPMGAEAAELFDAVAAS